MQIGFNKTLFILRICFCILLIFSWSLWLSLPSANQKKISTAVKQKLVHSKTNIKTHKHKDPFTQDLNSSKMLESPLSSEPGVIKAMLTKDEKLSEQNKKSLVKVLPTPETAIKIVPSKPEQTNVPTESKGKTIVESKPEQANVIIKVDSEKKEESKEKKIDLSFPAMADATSKALIAIETPKEIKLDTSETILRKQVVVNKPKQPISETLMFKDEPLNEGWLPQHLESMEIANKIPEQNNKPEHLFGQIELSGLANLPNGEQSFVLKDNSANIERVLTKGQLYKGFRVDEIRQNEVVFINVIQNRKYFKPLGAKN